MFRRLENKGIATAEYICKVGND